MNTVVRHFLLTILALYFTLAQDVALAQHAKDKIELSGNLELADGGDLSYRLSFQVSGIYVNGTSITTQDGTERKAKISGILNPEKKVLVITETESIELLSDSMEMCLFNILLKWKVKHRKYLFSGAFFGKNKSGALCVHGSATLEAPEESCVALKYDKETKTTVEETKIANDVGEHKIIEGIDTRMEWESSTCILETWDDGIVDGDVVSILVNGKEILTNYTLTGDRKRIVIPLPKNSNTITILAGDEGEHPPNTAQMVLMDGNKLHQVTAYNKKGKAASIVITKKQ